MSGPTQGGTSPASGGGLPGSNSGGPIVGGGGQQNSGGPVGTPQTLGTHGTEDLSHTVSGAQLLASFSDPDNDPLQLVSVTADHGSVIDNLDGTYTVIPNADFAGNMVLTVVAGDGKVTASNAVTVVFDGINDQPTNSPVTLTAGTEDTSVTITKAQLLVNAADVDVGDTLDVTGVTASSGSLTDNLDGTYTFVPAANSAAAVTFAYTVSDGNGGTAAGSATMTINSVNDSPTMAASVALTAIAEDTVSPTGQTVTSLLNTGFADADGNSLAGVAVISNNVVSPDGDWQYSSDSGTTWVDIGGVNDGSAALALSASTLVRFLPSADFSGATPSLYVRGLDSTYAGGWSDSSTATSVTVNTGSPGGASGITAAATELTSSVTAINDVPTFTANANHGAVTLAGAEYLTSAGAQSLGTNFTMEAWVKDNGSSMWGGIITTTGGTTKWVQLNKYFSGGVILEVSDGSGLTTLTSTTLINDGSWHHVAVSFDATTITLYVDGVAEATGAALPFADPVSLQVGISQDTSVHFVGSISDVKVWSETRTAAQIASDAYNDPTGAEPTLEAWYPLTEGSGTTATNGATSSFGNASATGTPSWITGSFATVNEDTTVTVTTAQLLAGAADADGDTLSVSGVTASSGSLTDNLDGTYTFVPVASTSGTVTFSYTVSDGNGGTVAASATLTVSGALAATAGVDALDGGLGGNTYRVAAANFASGDAITDTGSFVGDIDVIDLTTTGSTDLAAGTVTGIEKITVSTGAGATMVLGGGADPQQLTSITGGAGADAIQLTAAGTTLDLTGITISGIETISTGTGSDSVSFDDVSAPGAGFILDGDGSSGDTDTATFYQTQAGTLDISGKTFSAIEKVVMEVSGTSAGVTLVGHAQGTSFVGGAGNDVLTGGAGADVAVYSATAASQTFTGGTTALTVTGSGGADSLTGIETLRFSDRDLTLSGGTAYAETQVNTYTTLDQKAADVVTLADGGWVVAWQSNGQDGASWGVYAQIYNADGSVRGAEFGINTNTGDEEYDVSLAALTDGGFVATWVNWGAGSAGQDGDYGGIIARRFDSTGTQTAAEFVVNTTIAADQTTPNVSGLASGGYIVTYKVDDASYSGVTARIFDASNVGGVEIDVNQFTTQHQDYSDAVQLSNGDIMVVWQSDQQDSGDTSRAVYGRLMSSSGTMGANEFELATTVTGIQGYPSIAALDGGFVVVWESESVDGSGLAVVGQRFTNAGTMSGSQFTINNLTTTGDQSLARVTTLADGGFVVVWQCASVDGNGIGVAARLYDADGTARGSQFQVNTTATGEQSAPAVAALSDGGFVVTWQSASQDGNLLGIYSQRFAADGTVYSPLTLTGTATADTLTVGSGVDIVNLGDGADAIKTTDAVMDAGLTVVGGSGVDSISFTDAVTLVDSDFFGVSGIEQLQLASTAATAQTLTLGAEAQAGGITAVDATAATGSLAIDVSAYTGSISLAGGSGNDVFTGGTATDSLSGGLGADTFVSSAGADSIDGGLGTDVLDYSSDAAGVTVNLQLGTATDGWGATDTFTNIEKVVGSGYADTLTASGSGASTLTGGLGNDAFGLDSSVAATITDFTSGSDFFTLSNSEFSFGTAGDLLTSDYAESATAMSGTATDYGGGNTGTGLVAIDNGGNVELWSTTAMEAATTANSTLVGTVTGVDTTALDNTSFHLAV
ncbi:MAG: cadherin-like domain-containing protein [Alphaproteobacteria bacterium]|nr:cadherin-like domain-containing protein [Alphaproteobacteria bacterium]